jgi:hypothetical protein
VGQAVADDARADDHGAGPAGVSFMALLPVLRGSRGWTAPAPPPEPGKRGRLRPVG